MTVEQFFPLFLKELESQPSLWSYYKFHQDSTSFDFRKAYFCQRLEYISRAISLRQSVTWDVGCGYGTTAIFLALNGFKVHGTTLEFYYKELPQRLEYWSKIGDVAGFTYDYEDLFDTTQERGQYDYIIVQDTLHHLEPLDQALGILHRHLKPEGAMVVIEENGNNLIQSLKLYRQRGNKRIIELYDERLQKTILLGNENIRSLKTWKRAMQQQGLRIDPASVQFIRAFPPSLFNRWSYEGAVAREQKLWQNNALAREYLFFGINFIVTGASPQPPPKEGETITR